jgi:putative ABC transport system permease protein
MIFSIVQQALIFLPLVIGAYLTLSLLKLPDFSIESAYLFGAVAAVLSQDLPIPFVLLSAIGGGMIVGMIVSFLNQFLHIPFLLAAIVTNGLFHGLTQYVLGTSIASFHMIFPFPEIIFLICVTTGILLIFGIGYRSQLGYSLAIYGNNPQFFIHHSISSRYVVFFGVIVAHGCAGISGFLFSQSNGFVDLTMNFGIILLCLTSLMIGKFFISMHRPNLLIPLLGIFAFFLIQQFLLRMGLNLKYFNAFQALFILAILFIGHRKQTISLDHLGV